MSPCAAARPASDSRTRSAGSLRNFFIVGVAVVAMLILSVRGGGGGGMAEVVGMADGLGDRHLDDARRCHEVVGERRERGAGQTWQHVDRDQLVPMRRSVAD